MKKEGKGMVVVLAYILTMLLIGIVAIVAIRKDPSVNSMVKIESISEEPVTEIVYVPVYSEPESDTQMEALGTEPPIEYTIKSHKGRIGIFEDSKLSYLLDVYINTLPKTDRDLLEEGIIVYSDSELHSIIEDYTS